MDQQMEDAETDVDGSNIWCRFRRPLFIPGSKAADLNQDLFQLFLWGELNSCKYLKFWVLTNEKQFAICLQGWIYVFLFRSAENPILPKQDKIVSVMEKWNRTQALNVIHYVGEASITKIGWTLVLAALVASLIQMWIERSCCFYKKKSFYHSISTLPFYY